MQRGDLITSLIGAATRLANMLLRRMTEDYQNMIRELVLFFIFAAIRCINLPITVLSYLVKWFSSVQTRLILRQDLFTIFTPFQIQMIKELLWFLVFGRIIIAYCFVCRIFEEYSTISNTLLTPPTDTAGLMELIAYNKKVENILLSEMEDKLRIVMKYMMFLGDYTNFTPLEMKANNQSFHWWVMTLIICFRNV